MRSSKDYGRGVRKLAEVRGEEASKKSMEGLAKLCPDFERYAMEFVWGKVWTRRELDYRTKELITIAALTAMGNQLRVKEHIRDGLRNGITKDEILAVMLHLTAYAGFPAAANGIQVVGEVLAE
jgi:4-carboxymuconolactone decarboxylase